MLCELQTTLIYAPIAMTREQQEMFKSIKSFLLNARKRKQKPTPEDQEGINKLSFVNSFPARDRAFLTKVAGDLKLALTWDEYDDQDQNLAVLRIPTHVANGGPNASANADDESSEDDGGEEGRAAVDRVLRKYERLKLLEDDGDAEERYEASMEKKLSEWKRNYYKVRSF